MFYGAAQVSKDIDILLLAEEGSVPGNTSLMRCRQHPIWKVVDEGFADAIQALRFEGVRLEPVELV